MIRIILVDDHVIIREGVSRLLSDLKDVKVIGEGGDGLMALRLVEELSPDILVTDIGMANLNGIEATRKISKEFPNVKVIILSVHEDAKYVSEAIEAGAKGYVIKKNAFKELRDAIDAVTKNNLFLSPSVTSGYIKYLGEKEGIGSRQVSEILTPSEMQVFQLWVEGRSIKETCEKLHISERTVIFHRTNIKSKLNISDFHELVQYAISEGIIEKENK